MAVRDDMPRHRALSAGWLARLISRADVQTLISRWPVFRGFARRDGMEIFDVLQGFVASQVLFALIELEVLHILLDGPETAEHLAHRAGVPADRMAQLMRAGVALRLLKLGRNGRYRLSRRGAALLGVPGLEAMIRHNQAFYADMADPVALMRCERETALQRFWPYVFGASGDVPPKVVERYSDLMAQSQVLVAQDTLRMVPLSGVRRLLDVGGGAGMFLSHALHRNPKMTAALFDLPEVLPLAVAHLANEGLSDRVDLIPGSFRKDDLPGPVDAISLVRVLYDHDDATVNALLAKAYDTLPPGGRLIVSEPMSGGQVPERAGDVYFAFYTMAMGTGKVRSAERIAEMCRSAGFENIQMPRSSRPFITSALHGVKPGVRTA